MECFHHQSIRLGPRDEIGILAERCLIEGEEREVLGCIVPGLGFRFEAVRF